MRPGRRAFLRELAASAAVVAGFGSSRSFAQSFRGTRAGDENAVDGIRLCWCPAGRFVMGSPETERGHRPDEAQTAVTLTKGFWTAKHEVTQGQWKQVIGAFPDKLPSAEFGEGDGFPVYWITTPACPADQIRICTG